jgi:predicted nucleic acid-binding protein
MQLKCCVTTGSVSVERSGFILLALRENCQLLIADERLVNAVSQKLPQVVLLSSWSG